MNVRAASDNGPQIIRRLPDHPCDIPIGSHDWANAVEAIYIGLGTGHCLKGTSILHSDTVPHNLMGGSDDGKDGNCAPLLLKESSTMSFQTII